MFAPVADSDYMTFAQALVQRDRNGHVRASTGDCYFFIDPFAAAVVVEPVIMTGRCMPPWRSPWHRASPAARLWCPGRRRGRWRRLGIAEDIELGGRRDVAAAVAVPR
jgi:hypothetical protein